MPTLVKKCCLAFLLTCVWPQQTAKQIFHHVQVKSSSCCFLKESDIDIIVHPREWVLTHGMWHNLLQSENIIELEGISDNAKYFSQIFYCSTQVLFISKSKKIFHNNLSTITLIFHNQPSCHPSTDPRIFLQNSQQSWVGKSWHLHYKGYKVT